MVGDIVAGGPRLVYIDRLIMKAGLRDPPVEQRAGRHEAGQGQGDRGHRLRAELEADRFYGSEVVRDLAELKRRSDVIVANRLVDELRDVADKV